MKSEVDNDYEIFQICLDLNHFALIFSKFYGGGPPDPLLIRYGALCHGAHLTALKWDIFFLNPLFYKTSLEELHSSDIILYFRKSHTIYSFDKTDHQQPLTIQAWQLVYKTSLK